ncbi:MAG: class I tRNA ligase family protein, partial [Lewinella sp.]
TEWIEAKLNATIADVDRLISEYRLSEAMITLYRLIWSDFCSWYLEAIKPEDGKIARATYDAAISVFERMMILLHPFMPFITEEVWHQLRHRNEGEDCIVAAWPTADTYDKELLHRFSTLQDAVSHIRDVRNQRGISHGEELGLSVKESESSKELLRGSAGANAFLQRAGVLRTVDMVEEAPENGLPFLFGNDTAYLILNEEVDLAAERAKTEEELKRLRGFLKGVEKKLGNERFVANAPDEVVALERKKQADAQAKIASLEKML